MRRPAGKMGTEGDVILERVIAFLVDGLLIGVVSVILVAPLWLLLLTGAERFAVFVVMASFAAAASVVQFLYFIYMEGKYGQTLGKKLFDLVVVEEDGSPCSMSDSAIRNLLRIIDGQFNHLVGLIVILLTDRSQRIGDLAAKTIVVEAE